MKARIKELRKVLGLTQREFGDATNISHSSLAMFETGARVPRDIYIKQICAKFNVNEAWLRNGTPPMFRESNDAVLDAACAEYGLDQGGRAILETFLSMNLSEETSRAVIEFARRLVQAHGETADDSTVTAEEVGNAVSEHKRKKSS